MSLDRQSVRALWFWIVVAPLAAAVFASDAWDQWHSGVWESRVCVRGLCPHSPAEDAIFTTVEAAVALVVALAMVAKALTKPIVPRSNLTKVTRAICAFSFLAAGFASLARAWALAAIA